MSAIKECVALALQQLELSDYNIEFRGQNSKQDGYGSDIYYFLITGTAKNGKKKTFDFVAKSTKESKLMKEQFPITEIFQKEIFIYNYVKTAFCILQEDYKIQNFIEILPRCYGTHEKEDTIVLLFENLKTQGYDLMDKTIPWTWEATTLALKAYAKWHALSFALKIKKPDVFKELIKDNNANMYGHVAITIKFADGAANEFEKAKNKLISEEYKDVSKYLNYSKNDVFYALTDMSYEDLDYRVITHGDCWSSNFLLKFEANKNPIDIRLLDWQCAGFASPVFDLSHFIYACTDTEKFQDVNTILQVYYESFRETLNLFDCDADEVFSYEQLLDHWKKFSRYGLFLSTLIIKFCLCKTEENPDYEKSVDQKLDLLEIFNFSVVDEKLFYERTKNNFLHYCKNIK